MDAKMALVFVPLALSSLQQFLWPSNFDLNKKVYFQPPGYVFGIVWTSLYLLIGLFAYRLTSNGTAGYTRTAMMVLFAANLAINLMWTPVVNSLRMYTMGIYMIGVLILTTLLLIVLEPKRVSKALLVPYLTWLLFALLLNIELARLYLPSGTSD